MWECYYRVKEGVSWILILPVHTFLDVNDPKGFQKFQTNKINWKLTHLHHLTFSIFAIWISALVI